MAYSFLGEKANGKLYGDRGSINGFYLLNTGIILITDGKYKGQLAVPKWNQRKKLYQLVPSIYRVHRQAVNILAQYDLPFYGEKSKMREAIEIAHNLNLIIIGLKKGNIQDYEKKLASKVEEIFSLVGLVRNERKRTGLKVIEPIADITDSQGRVNPGALRARTIAGINRFQERREEIDKIEIKIINRLTASKVLFDFAEYIMASSCHFLNAIYNYSFSIKFKDNNIVRERMAGRLQAIMSDLETIKFQPFLVNCQLSIKELQGVKEVIRFGNILEGIRQIIPSYNSLRLKKIQGDMEDLIMLITFLINSQVFENEYYFSLILRLENIKSSLNQVSENDFQRKTVAQAINLVTQAKNLAKKHDLEETKEVLKKASEEITWY